MYRNRKGKEARFEIVHFPISSPFTPPLTTCHPLENSASERSLCWNTVFSSALYCFCFFFSSFYFFPSSFSLRAEGETMIKSTWFYVKFKYAEKVSQYVFFSQGKPATSLQASHVDGLLWLLREADEPRRFFCECVSSGLIILGWNEVSILCCLTLLLTKRKESSNSVPEALFSI